MDRERIHFLDSARALLMLLGVPYHAALVYGSRAGWLVDSDQHSYTVAWIGAILQSFRMPAFFIIAGFFAGHILLRRDAGDWLRGRLVRLGIPFLTACVLILPIQWAAEMALRPVPGVTGWDRLVLLLHDHPDRLFAHLWFLPVLMLQCLLLAWAWPRLHGRDGSRVSAMLGRLITSPNLGLGIAFGLAGYALLLKPVWMLAPPDRVGPVGMLLLEAIDYLGYFTVGVIAARHRAVLDALSRVSPMILIVTLIVTVERVLDYLGIAGWHETLADDFLIPLVAIGWTSVMLAALRRWANRPNALVRRLVDASFTIYLVHHPLVFLGGIALLTLHWPPVVEWPLLSIAVLLASLGIHWCINRSPRALLLFNGIEPAKPPAPSAQPR